MKVEEIMTKDVRSCTPADNLAEVVRRMWEADCGILPVVDEGKRVVGVLTDRDICVALATRDRTASSLSAGDVVSRTLHSCGPEDDVKTALSTLRDQRIRRLPVVDKEDRLLGILSMNDIALRAEAGTIRKPAPVSYADVGEALKGICRRTRQAAGRTAAAAGLSRAAAS